MNTRLPGVDLARGLAVFGMILVNASVCVDSQLEVLGAVVQVFSGRWAALFVVLAGVGLARGAKHARRVRLRALLLGAFGLAWLPLWPADILHWYGVWLFVGTLAWSWSSRGLLIGVLGFTLSFPLLALVFDYERGWVFATFEYVDLWTPAGFFRNLLFNGFHPVFPWTAFLLWGQWLGRQELESPVVRLRLVRWLLPAWILLEVGAFGLRGFLVAQGVEPELAQALGGTSPLPPMPLYVLGSGASASLVLIACLSVARPGVLAVVGRHALTHYVAHVLFLNVPLVLATTTWELSESVLIGLITAYCAVAALGSWAWARHRRRGPLEAVLRDLSSR